MDWGFREPALNPLARSVSQLELPAESPRPGRAQVSPQVRIPRKRTKSSTKNNIIQLGAHDTPDTSWGAAAIGRSAEISPSPSPSAGAWVARTGCSEPSDLGKVSGNKLLPSCFQGCCILTLGLSKCFSFVIKSGKGHTSPDKGPWRIR